MSHEITIEAVCDNGILKHLDIRNTGVCGMLVKIDKGSGPAGGAMHAYCPARSILTMWPTSGAMVKRDIA